jgi:hypothetical protein
MDLQTAKIIISWLQARVDQLETVIKSAQDKGDG